MATELRECDNASPAGTIRMKQDTVAWLLAEATLRLPGDEARAEPRSCSPKPSGSVARGCMRMPTTSCDESARRAFDAAVERRRRASRSPTSSAAASSGPWRSRCPARHPDSAPGNRIAGGTRAAATASAGGQRACSTWAPARGAVALAIAHERPRAQVTAIELRCRPRSPWRGRNATRLGLERVRFLRGDWFSAVADERFDLVLGNPPYIADDDPHLSQGDLRFEPRARAFSGRDGLDGHPRHRRRVAGAPAGRRLAVARARPGAGRGGTGAAAGSGPVRRSDLYATWKDRDRVSGGCRRD